MTVTITNKKKLSEYTFSDLKDFFNGVLRKISSKIILIEIGKDFINIGLAKSSSGRLLIKKVYNQKLPENAIDKSLPSEPLKLGQVIQSVLKELKINAQKVAICIPSDACYSRLIEIPENVSEKDSIDFLENPDSGIQIPISLANSDFDISLTSLPKKYANSLTYDSYFLTSIPQKSINVLLETIKSANLELCSIQMSHNCTSSLLKNEIENLDNKSLLISIELLDEFSQMVIFENSGPIHIKRLASIRSYPSIEEMKTFIVQENNPKNSKKAKGYLPLSKLDLKVLIREINNAFRDFKEENKLNKKGVLFLSGRNSQHQNLVEILGESLSLDTFLVSPPANHWLEEFTFNPDKINQFSMSRIIGLGLTLLGDIDSNNYFQNSNFIIQKYITKKEKEESSSLEKTKKEVQNLNIKDQKEENKVKVKDKKEVSKKEELPPLPNLNIKDQKEENKVKVKDKKEVSKKEELPPLPNLNIKDQKEANKVKVKDKKEVSKKEELPPLPNLNIKDQKEENKVKVKDKKEVSKKEELPPLPNLNIKDQKEESKEKKLDKKNELKNENSNNNNNQKFKMDTSFLDKN